jgi:hypothetical protein
VPGSVPGRQSAETEQDAPLFNRLTSSFFQNSQQLRDTFTKREKCRLTAEISQKRWGKKCPATLFFSNLLWLFVNPGGLTGTDSTRYLRGLHTMPNRFGAAIRPFPFHSVPPGASPHVK